MLSHIPDSWPLWAKRVILILAVVFVLPISLVWFAVKQAVEEFPYAWRAIVNFWKDGR